MEPTSPCPGGRRLILGLGNPGEEYRQTRHNAGFLVVEELARRHGVAFGARPEAHPEVRPEVGQASECRSRLAEIPAGWIGPHAVLLAEPQTYMNRSGFAARCLVERWQLPVADLLVVYDELVLPLGKLRLRPGGSPAGHRGLESILESLRTSKVPRLRLGIGPREDPDEEGSGTVPGSEVVDYVLSPFADGEREGVEEMIGRAADACELWLREGVEAAMNQFNG
jgi:peptidyl-tRNA hydrolase, PTH1 family